VAVRLPPMGGGGVYLFIYLLLLLLDSIFCK
jgi:hypothetical protein